MGTVTPPEPTPSTVSLPWYRRATLRLFFTLLVLVLFFLLVQGVGIYLQARQTLGFSIRQLTGLSNVALRFMNNHFEHQVEQLRQVLSTNEGFRQDLASLPELEQRPVDFQLARTRLISAFVAQLGEPSHPLGIDNMWITDKSGRVWIATREAWEGQTLPEELMAPARTLPFTQTRVFAWSELEDFGLQDPIIGVVYRVQDPKHQDWWFFLFASTNNVRLWLDSYQGVARNFTLHLPNGRVYRYSPILGTLTPLDQWPNAQNRKAMQVDTWSGLMSSLLRRQPAILPMTQDGVPIQVMYLPGQRGMLGVFQESQNTLQPFGLGVWISVRQQVTPVVLQGLRTSAVLTGGLMVFLILLSYGLARRITAPLLLMARQVQRFSQGEWDVRVPTRYGWGELAVLAQAFNHMAASLERMYRSLEAEVRRRTLQTELLRKWMQEHPPRSFEELKAYMHRAIQELQRTLPSGWQAVLVMWSPDIAAPSGRFPASQDLEASEATELRWTQEALRLKRPLMLTRETHAASLPGNIVGAWIYPLEFHGQPLGALILYRMHEHAAAIPQETLLSMAQVLATALYFARLFWEHFEGQRYSRAQLRFLRSLHEETDLMESLFLMVRFLERYLPRTIVMVRREKHWHVLHPSSLAGRTLEGVLPISRDQSWVLEPDLSSMRAVQRYPKDLRTWMQQLGWKGLVAFPLWSPRRLLGVVLVGMEAPGEYPEYLLHIVALGLQGLTLFLEQADLTNENRALRRGLDFLMQALQAPSLSQALSAFVRMAREVLQEDVDMVFGFADEPGGELTHTFLVREGQETFHFVLSPVEQALLRKGMQGNRPQLFHDGREMLRQVEDALGPRTETGRIPQSWVGVPLRFGGSVFGFWALRDMEQPHRFHEDVIRWMELLLPWLAAGLYTLIRRNRLEQQVQRLEWIHNLGLHFLEMWDPQVVTEEAAREMMRLFQAQAVVVRLHEPEIDLPQADQSEGPSNEPGPTPANGQSAG